MNIPTVMKRISLPRNIYLMRYPAKNSMTRKKCERRRIAKIFKEFVEREVWILIKVRKFLFCFFGHREPRRRHRGPQRNLLNSQLF
jgi:hypothetical protein